VLVGILVLNLLVALAKGVYGALSGSLAISSDAAHSAIDGSSNVVGVVALRFASRPPDADHPYGHRKIEIVAASLIGVAIGVVALELGLGAVRALMSGRAAPRIDLTGWLVMVGTLVVNVLVAWWERRAGRRLGSRFLEADAAHTASDVLVTLGVLGSMALVRAGYAWADPVASLVVMVVIARVAWQVLMSNVEVLIDRAAVDAALVRSLVLRVPGVTGCHRVRSRGGPGAVHVDLHVTADGAQTLSEAHHLSARVERHLCEHLPDVHDVTVHVEPEGDPEEGL
jgi:cation diffusion facilitator family transporter